MKNEKLKKMIVLSMLAAIAYLMVFLIRIPFIPAVEFLKYEPKDVVIAISGFLFGPLSATLVSIVVSLIEMVTISTTGPYGLIMNIFSTLSFVLPASIVYKRKKTIEYAVIGLSLGVVVMTFAMLVWNYFITPLYLNVPTEVVVGLMLPGFLPFNLIKALINAVITFVLYKPLVKILRKAKLMPKQEESETSEKKSALLFNIIAVLIFILLVSLLIIFRMGK